MHKQRIAIAGCTGRMGRTLIEAALANETVELAAAFEREGNPLVGRDAGEMLGQPTGVTISDDAAAAIGAADCVIDFTLPDGTLRHLDLATNLGVPMVIGTTGFDDAQKARIAAAAERAPVVFAPNMAVGVNAVFKLLETAARILSAGYDVEIIEAHHRHKVDAPSGTALRMGEVVAAELGRNLTDCAIYGRQGRTGERQDETIAFSTIRGGDIVGDHTVLFAGTGERIEITHRSGGRMPYAMGALRAAAFLRGRPSGLFDMQDVLGLR
ncbi:MAG: 4-hydroxy-tetrahydrodipicolinate reductase [Rhodocyclaceae bacterium]|nr:4-hydroxy-tetrahydrodipicolinate reductase [Rhodocyclaceae bacterium]